MIGVVLGLLCAAGAALSGYTSWRADAAGRRMEDELARLRAAAQSHDDEVSALRAEAIALMAERDSSNMGWAEAEESAETLRKHADELLAKLAGAEDERNRLKSSVARLQASLTETIPAKQALAAAVDEGRVAVAKLQQEKADLAASYARVLNRLTDIRNAATIREEV